MSAPATESRSLRPFFTVWTGQAFSLLGSQLTQFALVWWLTKITGSATALGIGLMISVLPQVFIGPFAGAFVDRWNRRTIMIAADAFIALATVLLAVLFALQIVQIWQVYTVLLLRAVGSAFHWPAMQASTTLLVPERHLSRVAGMNQTLYGALTIGAPPLGALLLGLLPMQGILAVDVGTAALGIAPLLFIDIPQPVPAEVTRSEGHGGWLRQVLPVLADIREGLRLVWGWKGLLGLIAIVLLLNLVTAPLSAVVPILVTRHFRAGAFELAWLESAFGVGMILGGVALGAWGGFRRRIVTMMVALICHGIGVTAIGVTPATAFLFAVGAAFFLGLVDPFINGPWIAMLQSAVPPEMQGRVFALQSSFVAAASPIGLAAAGPVVDLLGPQVWYLIAGMLQIVMGVAALFTPAIMQMGDRARPSGVALETH